MKNEIIVLDSNGVRLNRRKPKPKSAAKKQFFPLTKKPPTTKQLEKLEDAIWKCPQFRKTLLNLTVAAGPRHTRTVEGSIKNLPTAMQVARRHCWEVLMWRPSSDGTKVLVGNPYIK